ncbi:MAG TPA: MBL fold metallo-hydrolase [Methylomirabilota bacterium]|nr:MBL fold metallo-hydrolase [Methylomirabilota bacterium]
MSLPEVDRIAVTAVVDNAIDSLRRDEKVARRFTNMRARRMPTLRAEHGLAHWIEVTRGRETSRLAFDFGLTGESYVHNAVELGLPASGVDALVLSHGHQDHFGGLGGFLRTYLRFMRPDLTLYGGADHFLPRYVEREGQRVYIGRLDRQELERQGLEVAVVERPTLLPHGVMLSGEMREAEAFEPIPPDLRVERDGAVVPDTFIGEQTLLAHVRGRGLVVVTSCSHRGIVGICRHAVRVSGVSKVHAVVGGFHLSGLDEERISRVVDTFRELGVDYVIPQHCTGLEAMSLLMQRFPAQMVVSSVGSTFTFG